MIKCVKLSSPSQLPNCWLFRSALSCRRNMYTSGDQKEHEECKTSDEESSGRGNSPSPARTPTRCAQMMLVDVPSVKGIHHLISNAPYPYHGPMVVLEGT
jgi:hypothetical protein